MSARVIAALRKRAHELDASVPKVPVPVYDDRAMPSPYAHVTYETCRVLAREFRALADEAEGYGKGGTAMVKDPERGDFVKLSGNVLSIYEGTALVEVYRSDPVGLRVAVQCGALEHAGPVAAGDEVRP